MRRNGKGSHLGNRVDFADTDENKNVSGIGTVHMEMTEPPEPDC